MQSILEAGGCPLIVPLRAGLPVQELREEALALLQGMHGLLVASEGDVDSLQGQLPWEIALCVVAVQSHLPLLAVGRGIRVLRTEELLTGLSFRPSLHHAGNGDGIYRGGESYHPVHIIAGSRLAQLLGTTYLQVAWLHACTIGQLADGLEVCVYAPEGVVEGVFLKDENCFCLGVQFPPAQRLFDGFIWECERVLAQRESRKLKEKSNANSAHT